MKKDIYKQIVKTIETEDWDFDQVLEILTTKFPQEKSETLRAIQVQEYQRRVIRTSKSQLSEHNREKIYNDFKSEVLEINSRDYKEGWINRLAKKKQFSPAQFAKIILEEYHKERLPAGEETVSKDKISTLIKNTALIQDQKLATEIWLATVKDNNYGPKSEFIKSAIGNDYENQAKRSLERLNIAYQDENDLRAKGYDKTPDIKLDIPFAYNGYVINWIESKALFGDEDHHTDYLKNQLWSYWNRYGPGMVIYWFGFIDDIDSNRHKGIIVCDDFPQNIELCDPLRDSTSEDDE